MAPNRTAVAEGPKHAAQGPRAGFTLVELLVVVAIVGLLVALLLPAVQAAREAARRTVCENRLRQVGLAVAAHAGVWRAMPAGCEGCKGFGGRLTSWNTRLLPLLERQPLADLYDDRLPAHHAANRAAAQVVEDFLCPSEPSNRFVEKTGLWAGCAYTDYGGVYGVEGLGREAPLAAKQTLLDASLGVMLYDDPTRPAEVTDGLSHTLAVAELRDRRDAESVWTNGHNVFAQEQSTPVNGGLALPGDLGGPHPGGALGVACDARVVWLADDTAQPVLNAWLTRAGGEVTP